MDERHPFVQGTAHRHDPLNWHLLPDGFQAPSAHISHPLKSAESSINYNDGAKRSARERELFLFVSRGETKYIIQFDGLSVLLPPLRFAIAALEELDRRLLGLEVDDDVDRVLGAALRAMLQWSLLSVTCLKRPRQR